MSDYIPKSEPTTERVKYLSALYDMRNKKIKLSTFDLIVLMAVLIAILIALTMATAFIASALFAGFGIVVGVAIVIHKFEYVRKVIVKYAKWIDAGLLILGFAIAGSVEGMATAAFASLLISGYLIFARMMYDDDIENFSLFSPITKFFDKFKRQKNMELVVVN